MRLVLLGAPGSGKGTQAKSISDHFKIKKIVLGDILREEVKKGTELGGKVRGYMQKGLLVPDDIVALVIKEHIDNQGFVMDGYPRNINQAHILDEILQEKNITLDRVIYLDVTQDTVMERLLGRRVCKRCGANYHIKNMPPKVENVCDICGGELVQREDDTYEVTKKRWEVFQKEAEAILDYYRKKGILISVDANKNAEEVFAEILTKLDTSGEYS